MLVGKSDISYDDVIMDAETKTTIKQLLSIATFRATSASNRLLKLIRTMGVLLYGPPGTGKTHLCRAIANDSNQKLIAISPADVQSMWVGESEKYIKALFSVARKLFPCLIFVDEADALFYRRSSTDKPGQRSMLNQLLQEMDGLNADSKSPLVIIATNRPMDLDEAFLRRLPHKVHFKLPSRDERCRILYLYLHHEDLESNVSVEALADETDRFSGSDLRNLCVEAALVWKIEQINKTPKSNETIIKSAKILLSVFHFETALSRIAPTTSVASIDELKRFDARYNTRSVNPTAALLTSLKRKTPPQSISEHLSEKRLKGEKSFDLENVDSGGTTTPEAPNAPPAENAPNEQYTYEPFSVRTAKHHPKGKLWNVLKAEPQIRLLHLSPGTGSERLECSLQIEEPFKDLGCLMSSPQSAKPFYEAISYVWGDASMKEIIICDGKSLQITSSLANALRKVRYPERHRILWADGICINQADIEERGHQVTLMAAIYSAADQVLCCLGDDEKLQAKKTFELAKRLSEYLRLCCDAKNTRVERGNYNLDGNLDVLNRLADDKLENDLRNQMNDVQKFFQNPWLSRMWIRQEIGFASKARALCGEEEVDWVDLQHLAWWALVRGPQIGFQSLNKSCPHVGDFYKKSTSFLDLLIRARDYDCSNPVDHIFALLAHPSANNEIALPGTLKDYLAGLRSGSDEDGESSKTANIEKVNKEWVLDSISLCCDLINSIKGSNSENNSGQPLVNNSDGFPQATLSDIFVSGSGDRDFTADGDASSTAWTSPANLENPPPSTLHESTLDEPDEAGNSDRACAEVQDLVQQTGVNVVKEKEIIPDNLIRVCHMLSEKRKLDEYMNIRNHPINRATSSSVMTCAFSQPFIDVDYKLSIDDVCFKVAVKILDISRDLHLFSAVQHDPETKLEDIAVSWVPRWDHPTISTYLGVMSHGREKLWKLDKMNTQITLKENSPKEKILTMPGFLVDKIASSTDLITQDTFHNIQDLLYFWLTITDLKPSPQAGSLQRVEVYQRTLTAGNIFSEMCSIAIPVLSEEEVKNGFAAFWVQLCDAIHDAGLKDEHLNLNIFPVEELKEAAKKGNRTLFLSMADGVCRNRRVFRTSKGYLGVGPGVLQQDDIVCVLPYRIPFVLRPIVVKHDACLGYAYTDPLETTSICRRFRLVGECYVDDIMEGKAMVGLEKQIIEIQ